jgi:UDP-N-acetylglucosamine--N-acetylmuramyl-(pentapeptide) pyrophosphoryl-undecaprenol N-acetylglucosamine transferase (EC 2.4.1.227)
MNVLIAAGGTGGHVFPALAVAQRLRALGHRVSWIGAPDSFEARRVPAQGFEIDTVRVAGLRGKGLARWLLAPPRLLGAVFAAWWVLRHRRAQVLLGMGGYVAGPAGLAARLAGVPLVIHEQNAAAGLTNRLLARLAGRTLEAFPGSLPGAEMVGNPVRPGFAELPAPRERIGTRTGPLRLLVVGGSQGARALNEMLPAALALIPPAQRPQVRHQAGRTLDTAQRAYRSHGVDAEVIAFIDDMPEAFGWCDLMLCRAGASTIAELAAAGCPSLLVPYPHAVDDHQTRNAQWLVDAGAACLLPESELTPPRLLAALSPLLSDRGWLVRMGEAARARAWPDAAGAIARACLEGAR